MTKKRPNVLKSSALRISTPLANQIYPPPSEQINSDYEDEEGANEVGDRSLLPPPPPQSPPIRISSGIDNGKRIKANEDTVSRSETVDPDKSRQQRLPSGTPSRPTAATLTPNRINLTGQRIFSENNLAIANNNGSSTPVVTNKRITSGMLRIPEPRISEIEKELKEGPSSPSVNLPPKSNRIPMKRPYKPQGEDEVSISSSEDDQESPVAAKNQSKELEIKSPAAARQTSIADNNGSPTKNSPLDNTKLGDVNLAELPVQRKSSLEAKVESLAKNAASLAEAAKVIARTSTDDSINVTRKDNFTEEESSAEEFDELPVQDPNDTVRINRTESSNGSNTSFQKSELLQMIKGNRFDLPPRFKRANDIEEGSNKKRRPYTTVLNKDIDNSRPDPRNIMPERITRNAAKKAAQLLSSGGSRKQDESSSSESSGNDSSESDIETDESSEEEARRIAVRENDTLKKLNVHPLKARVIGNSEVSLAENKDQATEPAKNPPVLESTPSKGDSVPSVTREISSEVLGNERLSIKPDNKNTDSPKKNGDISPSKANINLEKKARLKETEKKSPAKIPNKKHIPFSVVKSIVPPPSNKENQVYQTPEFIEDSDDNETGLNSAQSSASSSNVEKKIPPSILKRKEEAERKRKEKDALKRAKEEEIAKKKAEREAKKKAKEEEASFKKESRT